MSRNRQLGCTIVNGTRTSGQIPTWNTPAYKSDCAGCDPNHFKPGPHKKHEKPDMSRSVSEPRDCLGFYQIYTDSLLTTIKTNRNGEHQTTDGGF